MTFLLICFTLVTIQPSLQAPISYKLEYANVKNEMTSLHNSTEDQIEFLLDKIAQLKVDHHHILALSEGSRREMESNLTARIEEVGKLKTEKKIDAQKLWLARVRAAVEHFQQKYGSKARFSKQDQKRLNGLTGHDHSHFRRELTFKWIFAHKTEDSEVVDLIAKINGSRDINDTNEFSVLIADAYGDISYSLHNLLFLPGSGNYEVEYATRRAKMNRAVALFWSNYEFKDYIAKQLISSEVTGQSSTENVNTPSTKPTNGDPLSSR